MCTHPVPLHAHTHFLASLRAALILNAGQTVPAPPPVALCILEDFHHACLVDGVNALMEKTDVRHTKKEAKKYIRNCTNPDLDIR